jgi:hypothetical protein
MRKPAAIPTPKRREYPTTLADMLAHAPGTVDFETWRRVRLTERAMAGDLDCIIEWLQRFGGPEWQPRG